MPNERWSTTRRAKFSFKHSIGRTRSGRFFLYACRINYVQLLTLIVDIRGRRHEATYECQVKIPFHHGLRYSDESIWEQPFQKSFDSHYLHRRQCNAKLSLYSYRVGLHCSAFTPHLSNLTTRNTGDRQNLTKVRAKETYFVTVNRSLHEATPRARKNDTRARKPHRADLYYWLCAL